MDLTSTPPIRARRRLSRPILASLLFHLLVIGSFLRHRVEVAPMRMPGTAHGSRIELTYSPGRAPVRTAVPNPKSSPQIAAAHTPQPSILPAPPAAAAVSANTNSPETPRPDSTSGADALGDGNVSIALADHFPTPRPDLSVLAHGTAGDVILDIVIDSTGKISDIKVARGLASTIDQTVIATVQQWTFHPATRDGQPIASEQELHFHYERRG